MSEYIKFNDFRKAKEFVFNTKIVKSYIDALLNKYDFVKSFEIVKGEMSKTTSIAYVNVIVDEGKYITYILEGKPKLEKMQSRSIKIRYNIIYE